jgi:hypothetical protein
MFDKIKKNSMFRRFKYWTLLLTIIYIYIMALNLILRNTFDYLTLNLILYGATIGLTAMWTLISWVIFEPRCSMCQKTNRELKQPPSHHPVNGIGDYLFANLCHGCLVRSYDRDIKRRIEEIDKFGSMNFYKKGDDE